MTTLGIGEILAGENMSVAAVRFMVCEILISV